MRVRSALLFALLAPSACLPWKSTSSIEGCEAETHPFTLDTELTEAQVQDLLSAFGVEDPSELDCAAVCERMQGDMTGMPVYDIASDCELIIDAPTTEDPEEIVGALSCEGLTDYLCEGRRPLGHVEQGGADGLAGYLAGAAHLEAASVLAFDELAGQLTRWGAPEALISRCRQAAEQERAHASAVGALATARGATPLTPAREAAPDDLFTAALHNAVEGCVGETWAALLAGWKAGHASTEELRRVYASLAADEASHAELAWDLHAWMLSRLDEAQRDAVNGAQRRALSRLPEVAARQSRALPAELGLPRPELAARLARRFALGLTIQA